MSNIGKPLTPGIILPDPKEVPEKTPKKENPVVNPDLVPG